MNLVFNGGTGRKIIQEVVGLANPRSTSPLGSARLAAAASGLSGCRGYEFRYLPRSVAVTEERDNFDIADGHCEGTAARGKRSTGTRNTVQGEVQAKQTFQPNQI